MAQEGKFCGQEDSVAPGAGGSSPDSDAWNQRVCLPDNY